MSNPLISPPVGAEVSLLEKGIRAARRGQRRHAHQLLTSAVGADPANEEAWLWLARVEEDAATRTGHLRQVIELNPNNQWAHEQLAALQSGQPEQTPPPLPSTATPQEQVQLRLFACPNCGAALSIHSPETQTLVCRHCQRILELNAEQAQIIGNASGRAKPSQPIHLGDRAALEGKEYEVIGWLRYEGRDDEDTWRWDEWLLLSTQGELRWLSHDPEQGFLLQTKTNFTAPFDFANATAVPTPEGNARVTEREQAKLIALAGELTWRATLGDTIRYLEATARQNHYSVELIAQQEIELFRGVALTPRQLWTAFNNTAMLAQLDTVARWRPAYRGLAILALLLTLACGIGALLFANGQTIFAETVQLTQGSSQRLGPIPFSGGSRANQVELAAVTALPANSAAEVDVTLIDRTEAEFPLFAYEFWHETGSDDEGPWAESSLVGTHLFRFTEANGPYFLEVMLDETTVPALAVRVTVQEGVWLMRYWGVGLLLFLGCTVLFFILSNRKE